ncbi:MAG: glycosyltransferase family 2 protein, partial [Pseudomonadota bacterium]
MTVVIPNWNGAHHLPECLASLEQQTFRNFETVLVDNGSSDDSLALLAKDYPWVTVIARGDNGGFSTAVNEGIRRAESELVVLLNNDTRADPNWLDVLQDGMRRYPEASMGASRMLLYDPPHDVDSAGDGYSLSAGAGYNLAAGEARDSVDEDAWVFGACAGAAVYRRALFDDIGLFDEDFFLVFEDVDMDLRAQVAGHRCIYLADAIVYHKRGASTDNASMEVIARSWRNTLWVAGKNLPLPLFAFWLTCFGLRMIRMFGMAILFRGWKKIRPAATPKNVEGTPAPSWRQGVINTWYWPALKRALTTLPRKRREVRKLRRLGTFRLLP